MHQLLVSKSNVVYLNEIELYVNKQIELYVNKQIELYVNKQIELYVNKLFAKSGTMNSKAHFDTK